MRYLLDTNVVSELRKAAKANPNVNAWAESVAPGSLFLSAIVLLELELGVPLMERRDPRRAPCSAPGSTPASSRHSQAGSSQ